MILSDVRQAVRSNLDDMQYDAAKIDQAINWYQNELFTKNDTGLMETTGTVSVGAGSAVGDLSVLASPVNKLLNLTATSPRVFSLWRYRLPQQTFDLQYPDYTGYTARELYNWTTYGNNLLFSAPAAATTTLRVDYLRDPTYATDAAPTLEAPDKYFEMYVLGAQARIMEVNEDFEEAKVIRGNLFPLEAQFKLHERRGGKVAGPSIMRSNRRGHGGGFGDPEASFY